MCIISSSYAKSNWSYSPETVKLGCDLCDFDLWSLTMTVIVGRVEKPFFITHSHVVKCASVTNTHQLQTLNCNTATVGNISGYRPRGLVLWSNLAINQYCFWLPTKLEIVIFSEAWDRKRQNSVFYLHVHMTDFVYRKHTVLQIQ